MSINETITIKDPKAAAEAREVQEEAREHNVSQNSVPSDIKGRRMNMLWERMRLTR